MKIRTQLVVASLILSILPLSLIVIYSYESSKSALESAYRREAASMTRQMDRRLWTIRTDLEQRLAEVSSLPLHSLPKGDKSADPMVGNILMAMGDSAALVHSLEIQRLVPPPPPSAEKATAGPAVAARAATAAAASVAAPRPVAIAGSPNVPGEAPPAPPEAPADPDEMTAGASLMEEPIVIDLPAGPQIPRFAWSAEQRDQLQQLTRLSREVGSAQMTPEQRAQKLEEFKKAQADFDRIMRESEAAYQKTVEGSVHQEEARQESRAQQRERTRLLVRARMPRQRIVVKPGVLPGGAAVAAPVLAPSPAKTAAAPAAPVTRNLTEAEKVQWKEQEQKISLLFGQHFHVPLRKEGTVVGQLSAQVSTEEVIRRVLGTSQDRDEIAFAVDRDQNVYTRTPQDRGTLDRIGVLRRLNGDLPLHDIPNWVVALSRDPQSGLRIGVARPVGDTFEELRRTAARNFGYGIGLIFVALLGIVPVANHMTRDVNLVTAGAERISQGDLMTRVPVRSKNEFGQLATAFNRMAADLSQQQQTIVEQTRERKESEIQQRILALEYDRKTVELEDARRFQLSMLPKCVPEHPRYELAVRTHTATEVGGDYYDFHLSPDHQLSVTVGDATGHGAKAGTMVTVIKTLFAGYRAETRPDEFLRDAADKVKRMDLGRMSMALMLARFEDGRMLLASAGMPPAYVYRRDEAIVEEIALSATPLGTLGSDYHDVEVPLAPGDTVLFMSDGFPELLNESGVQIGYPGALDEFRAAATAPTARGVIDALSESARSWHGDQPPNDDVTFVVIRLKEA